jgi:hypothetical protein
MSRLRALLWLSGLSAFALLSPGDTVGAPPPTSRSQPTAARHDRLDAIVRAQVWRQPVVPVSRADLDATLKEGEPQECWFKVTDLGGTTPKFDCALANGEEVRIKYGFGAESHAEVAATRLLAVLGFGADHVVMVPKLRCFGCPFEPYVASKIAEVANAGPLLSKMLNERRQTTFEWVSLERKFEAPAMQTGAEKGWSIAELDLVDASKGGASRAHVDALRLLVMFLAHWDNKARNQRLVCLTPGWSGDGRCPEPFLLLHDVGATFGPRKVNLSNWEQTAIWDDRATCSVAMDDLPHGGATFQRVRIGESGRRFLAGLLAQLTDGQITDLFASARFDKIRDPFTRGTSVGDWVRVFKAKVAEVHAAHPCPQP